jgi:Tol biopolymer transport system component
VEEVEMGSDVMNGKRGRWGLLGLVASAAIALTVAAASNEAFAAYPGGNGKIAFRSGSAGSVNFDIWSMNPDGSGLTQLTNDPASDFEPVWSPDGSKIAFRKNAPGSGSPDIWVMNADGSGQTNLTPLVPSFGGCPPTPGNGEGGDAPTWSPDGARIAYSGEQEIWVMNADGSGKTDITCTTEAEIQPAWSPDGTKIAYVRSGDVWAMNANGSGQTPLTGTPQNESQPDWSPDGTKIVYQKGAAAIWVMNADGSGQTGLVTTGPGGKEPAWSPDGTKVTFSRNEGQPPGYNIFVVNANGSGLTLVPSTPAGDQQPDWQPLPGPAAPTISSFSPTSGITGSKVMITGTNFTGAKPVKFNGKNAKFKVLSETTIEATVPNGATTGKITVKTPGGTATSDTNFVVTLSITKLEPLSGPVGTEVTISGVGFADATAVAFNGVAATFTILSPTSIRTMVPTGATTGPVTVTDPQGTVRSAKKFTVV